jgi:hypothetical protein
VLGLAQGPQQTFPRTAIDLDRLVIQFTTKRTARAWLYHEQLRDILNRKQINVVSTMLRQWCTNVMRSKVEPMKQVAAMIRNQVGDGVLLPESHLVGGMRKVRFQPSITPNTMSNDPMMAATSGNICPR